MAGKTGKRGARRGTRKAPRKPSKPAAGGRTIVQLNFHDNPPKRGNGTMGAPKGRDGRTLKGAALAAHQRAAGKRGGGGHKGGGHRKNALAKTNPANPGTRRRRRRNGTTFMQALVKVAGAAAAMFGSGVVVTYGVSKIMPGSKVSGYGIPVLAGVIGAGIATKYPLVGAGVAAGGAAPFVLPVAARVMQPSLTSSSTTVSSLRAVSSSLRHNNPGLLGAVRMSAVSMGRVSMGRHAYAH